MTVKALTVAFVSHEMRHVKLFAESAGATKFGAGGLAAAAHDVQQEAGHHCHGEEEGRLKGRRSEGKEKRLRPTFDPRRDFRRTLKSSLATTTPNLFVSGSDESSIPFISFLLTFTSDLLLLPACLDRPTRWIEAAIHTEELLPFAADEANGLK